MAGNPDGAHHRLGTERRPSPLRADDQGRHDEHDGAHRPAYTEYQAPRHGDPRPRIEEEERTEQEGDEPPHPDQPEGGEEHLRPEERDTEQHERQARGVERQDLERRQREEEADRARHPGKDDAGVRELDVEAEDTRHHEQICDVRVSDDVQDALPEPHRVGPRPHVAIQPPDRHAQGQRSPLVPDLHPAPVRQSHDLVEIVRHEVDDSRLGGLVGGDRDALADRARRPFDVPTPPLGDRFAEGSGEVLELLAHHALDVLAGTADRVRRPDVRPRRHGGHVGRQRDEHTGRAGARAARGHVHDHREGSGQDVLDHRPRGRQESARRVELDDQGGRPFALGARDGLVGEIGHRRVDRPVDHDACERAVRERRADESGGPQAEQQPDARRGPLHRGPVPMPSSSMTFWMSCQTSRLSAGLRRR